MSRHMYLPRGKRIVLYRSGDKFYSGTPFTLNPRYIRSVNDLLSEATTKVDAVWGAVRSIHTPNTGTKVNTLEAITHEGAFVAAGTKGFIRIPGGYENIGKPVVIRNKRTTLSRIPSQIPSRRSYYGYKEFTVAVYRNGDNTATYPFTFTNEDYKSWEKALDRLSQDVPNGPIRRIFYLSGNSVQSPQDLINHGTYVVAGKGESFQPAQYGDVTLGVEDDDGNTAYTNADRRWSLSSQRTEDSGGRFSNNFDSMFISENAEREEVENDRERRWDEEEEEEDDGQENKDKYGDEAEYSYYENYKEIEEEEVDEKERRDNRSEWTEEKEDEEAEEDAGGGGGGGGGGREEGGGEEEDGDNEEDNAVIVFGDRTSFRQASPEGAVSVSLIPSSSSTQKARWRELDMPPQIPEKETEGELEEMEEEELEEEEEEEEEEDDDDWRDDNGEGSISRLSAFDSGRASLFSDEERPDSVFKAKARFSRPATRAMEVDYDTDDGGVYKAKHRSDYAAQEVLESSATNIELPVDMFDAAEVQEEIQAS